jgi:hypothetical protein
VNIRLGWPLDRRARRLRAARSALVIPREEARFLGFATLDDVGRPFAWDGGVYRGIYPGREERVRRLFSSGLVEALVSRGLLVPTELTSLRMEGFSLVLRHEPITAALPTEWTASMLRDACTTILTVNRICQEHGHELTDAHPYNVSFHRSRPVWIDIGSIGPRREGWSARSEFVDFSVMPLAFLLRGDLLEGYGILMAERSLKIAARPFRQSVLFERFLAAIGESAESFRDEHVDEEWISERLPRPRLQETLWSGYQHGAASVLDDLVDHPGNRFRRFFEVSRLLGVHAPGARTCLDLAGNVGLASMILSERHPHLRCLNTDNDPLAIERSYALLRQNPRFRVESYLLNFMLPMYADSVVRFRSDVVLALAITHHLLLSQGHKLDEILEKLAAYSRGHVLVEFMPLGLWGGDPAAKPEVPPWYTTDWFEAGFRRHFDLRERAVIEAHPITGVVEAHRVLFVGRVRG